MFVTRQNSRMSDKRKSISASVKDFFSGGNSSKSKSKGTPSRPDSTGTLSFNNPFTSNNTNNAVNTSQTYQAPAPQQNNSEEPPPAYTPTQPTPSAPTGSSNGITSKFQAHPIIKRRTDLRVDNDPYAFLRKFDTVFLIDDSGSMAGSRWRETCNALSQLLDIVLEYDEDGVDFYFINHVSGDDGFKEKAGSGYRNVTRARGTHRGSEQLTVEEIFRRVQPRGGTMTGMRLDKILGRYLRRYEAEVERTDDETCLKPLNIIVITDGAASDHPRENILSAAVRLDRIRAPIYQVGIQFFQVGHDPDATRALKVLDDDLYQPGQDGVPSHGCRDMVDTTRSDGTTMTAQRLLKALQGGVDKHWDRRK